MRILINKLNNDKFKFKKFLLQSGSIPEDGQKSGLFCKDATHIHCFASDMWTNIFNSKIPLYELVI